jgi:hypothetical protein
MQAVSVSVYIRTHISGQKEKVTGKVEANQINYLRTNFRYLVSSYRTRGIFSSQ